MHFKDFCFHPAIASAIDACGYVQPTDIQQQTIPHLLQGRDLLGLAQTGTGKTAAFILPTLQKLEQKKSHAIKALILTPTRELAEQVQENIQQLSKGTGLRSCSIYGGVSKLNQEKKIKRGVDLVVACPGRLLDHLNSGTIDLSAIEVLILDEADQMCDKGFLPDIRRILTRIPQQRQSMVFSATMPGEVRHFVEDILTNPVTVQVDHEKPAATISHALFQVAQSQKTALLKKILQGEKMTSTLVFTRTKYKAKNLARQLQQNGFRATSIQGNLSQNQRKTAMDGFKSGKFNILVATDIAARGIDVSDISHVVNYDVPDTVETYTHRTGRTGRAKKSGQAYTFATSDDRRIIKLVERNLGKNLSREQIPGFEAQSEPTSAAITDKKRTKKHFSKRGKKHGFNSRKKSSNKRSSRAASFDFGLTSR